MSHYIPDWRIIAVDRDRSIIHVGFGPLSFPVAIDTRRGRPYVLKPASVSIANPEYTVFVRVCLEAWAGGQSEGHR